MKRERLEKEFGKYTKEQIIRALTTTPSAWFSLEDVLARLEFYAKQDLLDRSSAATEKATKALSDCMEWRREMCEKYGNGGDVKLENIPSVELERGRFLERVWKSAHELEEKLDAAVMKMNKGGGVGK